MREVFINGLFMSGLITLCLIVEYLIERIGG